MNWTKPLLFGAIIAGLGLLLLISAGTSAGQDELHIEDYVLWQGTFAEDIMLSDFHEDNEYKVYIKPGGEYQNLNFESSSGEQYFRAENFGNKDDGWIEIGFIEMAQCPCTLNLNASNEVIIVDSNQKSEDSGAMVDSFFLSYASGCCLIGIGSLVFIIESIRTKEKSQEVEIIQH